MNCRRIEKQIYLYNELSPPDRNAVDDHVDNCTACRQVLENAKAVATLNSCLAGVPPLSDESAMTQRIMSAVYDTKKEKSSVFSLLGSTGTLTPLRYAMTALSLFLVVHFVDEYSRAVAGPVKFYPVRGAKAELNTASFHDAFVTAKQAGNAPASLYECISRCLQKEPAVCPDCKVLLKQNDTP